MMPEEEPEKVHFVKAEDVGDRVADLFALEKEKLLKIFPTCQAEHIGGTSVPGSVTKGDLDINLRVPAEDFFRVVEELKNIYQINQPNNWSENFASFKDDSRDLGIQVTVLGSPEDYYVAQREYLINHSEELRELNSLKLKYEGKDMQKYREEKGNFFEKLNRKLGF